MKIKFIAPIVALAAASLFTACNPERLEIPQKGVVNTETFYQTDEDAQPEGCREHRNLLSDR